MWAAGDQGQVESWCICALMRAQAYLWGITFHAWSLLWSCMLLEGAYIMQTYSNLQTTLTVCLYQAAGLGQTLTSKKLLPKRDQESPSTLLPCCLAWGGHPCSCIWKALQMLLYTCTIPCSTLRDQLALQQSQEKFLLGGKKLLPENVCSNFKANLSHTREQF